MFAASASTIMDSTTAGGPPAASIMVDADAANISNTYANTYPIFVYLPILHIFVYILPGYLELLN